VELGAEGLELSDDLAQAGGQTLEGQTEAVVL
jgi:hypothetical protein